MKLFSKITRQDFWFLVIASFFFFLLRLPSLFEPYWYGDEGIYEVVGFALRQGRFLYTGIWDNKPPMLYLIYALFWGDQFPVRLLNLLFGLGAIVTIFILSKKLFSSKQAQYIATGLFAFLFGIPFLEGNIANAENFMLFPVLIAGVLVFGTTVHKDEHKKKSFLMLLAAGLLLGFSFLIKVVAIFDLAAFSVFLLFTRIKKLELREFVRELIGLSPLIAGFLIPLSITILFFLAHGQVKTFITSAFLSNASYVNFGNQIYIPFTKIVVPQGLLLIKLVVLAAVCVVLFWKRKLLSPAIGFIALWLSFSVFNSFFAQRPYTHYLLVLVPSLCLFIALTVDVKKLRTPIIAVSIIVLLLLAKNFYFYAHTFGYYTNFISFVTDGKTVDEYRGFFDSVVPRDYTIASYINTHIKKGQSIFLWGNSAQIYKLTNTISPGKYPVAYWAGANVNNRQETMEAVAKLKPRFIIIFPNQDPIPYSLIMYKERFIIDGATLYEKIF